MQGGWIVAATLAAAAAAGTVVAQEETDIAELVLGLVADRDPEVRVSDDRVDYERLIARRIDLVDSNGVIRMTLAGELPNPVVDGIEYRRDVKVGGLMLRDEAGNERGGFGYNERFGPLLALDHPTGEGAGFAIRPDGGAFIFLGQRPEPVTHEDLAGHMMPGGGSATSLGVSISPEGEQSVELADRDGRARLRLTVTEEGYGAIEFLNAQGEVVETYAPEATAGE